MMHRQYTTFSQLLCVFILRIHLTYKRSYKLTFFLDWSDFVCFGFAKESWTPDAAKEWLSSVSTFIRIIRDPPMAGRHLPRITLSHASFWPAPAKSGTTVQDRGGGAKIYNCPRTAAAQCCFIDNNVRWRKLICGRNSHCAKKLMWRLSPHLTCSDDLVSHVNFSWESQKLICDFDFNCRG